MDDKREFYIGNHLWKGSAGQPPISVLISGLDQVICLLVVPRPHYVISLRSTGEFIMDRLESTTSCFDYSLSTHGSVRGEYIR